ncbi:MAG: HRDC domain-containing protein [Actinomycetota bacterium]|nr:HRDC domain-containing protein [Actinomycetota bacterium]
MPNLVVQPSELEDVIDAALAADRYAIDTEFHRERTYFPQVALIQLAWDKEVVLIDPLALDLTPLARLLGGPGLCVLHAGVQDLEVLDLATGATPRRLFDTQIAAGFLGYASGSLASLLDSFLKVAIAKGDRLTDWLRRPLTPEQLLYAAGDVEHLLELTDAIVADLDRLGRLAWAEEECAILLERPRNLRPSEDAVRRIKDARKLKGDAANVARAVAAWRERRAAALDVPVRQVLPDIGVVAIAQRAPKTIEDLDNLRGLDRRHSGGDAGRELLTAVQAGLRNELPDPTHVTRQAELPKHLRPAVALIIAWVAQVARDAKMDPALIATRTDVESLLSDPPCGRLLAGWRADLVGEPVRQLVSGGAALAFEKGNLLLEPRRAP